MESLRSLFRGGDFTPWERVIFNFIESLLGSVSKYTDQAQLTIGHLQGYLEAEIEWIDELLAENRKIKKQI